MDNANEKSIQNVLGSIGHVNQYGFGNHRTLTISVPNLTPAEAMRVAEAVKQALEK